MASTNRPVTHGLKLVYELNFQQLEQLVANKTNKSQVNVMGANMPVADRGEKAVENHKQKRLLTELMDGPTVPVPTEYLKKTKPRQ